MTGVSIRADDSAIQTALAEAEARTDDLAPLMRAVAKILLLGTQRRFERQVDADGKPWQRLSPRTAARRIGRHRRGFGNILRSEGHLYGSITAEASGVEAAVGSNLPYAAIHQLGGVVNHPARERQLFLGRRNVGNRFVRASDRIRKREVNVAVGGYAIAIPARPYLGVSEQERDDILAAARDHVGGAP